MIMIRRMALPLVLAALTLSACDSSGPENRRILLDQLARQEALWAQVGASSYSLAMTRDCFCDDDSRRWQVNLEIVDDQVVSGEHVFSGAALTSAELAEQYVIEDLFDLVRDALNRGVATVNIAYNVEFGYVQELYVDYNARTSSDDIIVVVDAYTPSSGS